MKKAEAKQVVSTGPSTTHQSTRRGRAGIYSILRADVSFANTGDPESSKICAPLTAVPDIRDCERTGRGTDAGLL